MDEIKVYHSLWRNAIVITVCVIVICAILIFHLGKKNPFMDWFFVLFFGGVGLFSAYTVMKERIKGKPYIVITDKKILVYNREFLEIRFADIESFSLSGKNIVIEYKNDATLEVLMTGPLTITPQKLCELMNERLTTYRQMKIGEVYISTTK